MTKRLMTIDECAEYIGSTPGTLYQRVSKRTIPFIKMGRSVRFDVRIIDQWIDKQARQKNGTSLSEA